MKIEFAQSAVSDIDSVIQYYRSQGEPKVGEKFVKTIFQKIERLYKYPDSGRIVPEHQTLFIREIIVSPFRVVYRREEQKILIIRVWRSERSLKLDQ
jgi:plasmid stabilization system protein ParE